MRARGSGSPRNLAILGGLLALAAIPVACAQGLVLSETGPAGKGGGGASTTTGSVTTTVVSVTTGVGGVGGVGGNDTSNGGFGGSPAGVTSSIASVSSSSGGPSSECDTGDCNDCGECAECLVCANQTFDCEFDPDCSTILCCIANCPQQTAACLNDCIAEDPAGESLFEDFYDCLLCACQSTCDVPSGTCQ